LLPEADLFDTMLLPDLQRVVFEPGQQVRHSPGHSRVDAEFVDHLDGGLFDGMKVRIWCSGGS